MSDWRRCAECDCLLPRVCNSCSTRNETYSNTRMMQERIAQLEAKLAAAESLGEQAEYEYLAECQYSGSFPCNPTCDDSGWCYRKRIDSPVQDQKTAGDSHE